jgi:hypothetical protein
MIFHVLTLPRRHFASTLASSCDTASSWTGQSSCCRDPPSPAQSGLPRSPLPPGHWAPSWRQCFCHTNTCC